MSHIPSNFGVFDPKWGTLAATLQYEGWTGEQVEQAKSDLRVASQNPHIPVSQEVQTLYSKVFPKNRRKEIDSIKKEVRLFIEQKLKEVLEGTPEEAQQTLSGLLQPGSYIDEQMRRLRQLGECKVTGCYFYNTYSHYSAEERNRRVEAVVQEVICDFFDGLPTSFPMMAHILQERIIGFTKISHIPPVSDVPQSLQILRRLADIGVENAQKGLSSTYAWNTIGTESEEVGLQQKVNDRINELRKLALAGQAPSQYELGSACYHMKLGSDSIQDFSEEERRRYIQELMDNEVSFNYYVLAVICANKIGELPLGFTLEKRFAILHERAQNGDNNALHSLYDAYRDNKLGDDKLQLTQAQRFEKLKSLRQYNPTYFDNLIVLMYINNQLGSGEDSLRPNLSDTQRLQWLEDQALNHGNSRAQEVLAKAYANNHFCSELSVGSFDLHMSFEERVKKLKTLADKGCRESQNIFLKHYGFLPSHIIHRIVRDTPTSAEEPSQQLEAFHIADELPLDDLLRWSLFDYSDHAERALCMLAAQKSKAISFLLAVRKAV